MSVEEHFGLGGLKLIDRIVRSAIRRKWKDAYSSFEELKSLIGSRVGEDEDWYAGALMAVKGLIESLREDSKALFRKALDMSPEEIERNISLLRKLMGGSVAKNRYDEGYMETSIYILDSLKRAKLERLQ